MPIQTHRINKYPQIIAKSLICGHLQTFELFKADYSAPQILGLAKKYVLQKGRCFLTMIQVFIGFVYSFIAHYYQLTMRYLAKKLFINSRNSALLIGFDK